MALEDAAGAVRLTIPAGLATDSSGVGKPGTITPVTYQIVTYNGGPALQASIPAGPAAAVTPTPPQLYGPYWHWTRKRAGKTISRLVPADQVDTYRQWLDNHRRLRELVAELEDLTLAVADQHSGYQARARQTRQARS